MPRHEITYRGHPALAGALAQMLQERGVEVEWERPVEQRGFASAVEGVVVAIVSYGGIEAIKAAIAEFRRRFPGGGDALRFGENRSRTETRRLRDAKPLE
jgi:hypothetical protein